MYQIFFQDPTKYPPQIKSFAGKEFTLKIELNDDNILLNSTVFYAVDAYDYDVATSSRSGTTVTDNETSNFGDVSLSISNIFICYM